MNCYGGDQGWKKLMMLRFVCTWNLIVEKFFNDKCHEMLQHLSGS